MNVKYEAKIYFTYSVFKQNTMEAKQKRIWRLLLTALFVGGIAVTKHFGYFLEPPLKTQEADQPANTPSSTAKGIAQTTINQDTNGIGNCPSLNNGDNNSINTNCSTTKIETIEEQINNPRNIQAEQYIEKTGDNNTNCAGNENSACGNNSTFNINTRQ